MKYIDDDNSCSQIIYYLLQNKRKLRVIPIGLLPFENFIGAFEKGKDVN